MLTLSSTIVSGIKQFFRELFRFLAFLAVVILAFILIAVIVGTAEKFGFIPELNVAVYFAGAGMIFYGPIKRIVHRFRSSPSA